VTSNVTAFGGWGEPAFKITPHKRGEWEDRIHHEREIRSTYRTMGSPWETAGCFAIVRFFRTPS
jgi:hypothetical protein